MKLLAIDTSTEYLGLAVARDGKVIARMHRKVPMMHSTLLAPAIKTLLGKARMRVKDLDGFCISVGPGSFTGLRIGVTTVKGLAYATGKPIAAVPTLDVIAENAARHVGAICPVLNARKGKVYAAIYRSDGKTVRRLSGYLLLPLPELIEKLKDLDDIAYLGDMAEAAASSVPGKLISGWHPRAAIVARRGMELFRKKRFAKAEKLEPLYLYSRECDIKGY